MDQFWWALAWLLAGSVVAIVLMSALFIAKDSGADQETYVDEPDEIHAPDAPLESDAAAAGAPVPMRKALDDG
jgi:hypothetical protein